MNDDKLRRRIAVEAASLLMQRKESLLTRARMRAARQICRGYVPRDQFPSEAEIRDEIEKRSYVSEGDARFDNLRTVRLAALDLMRSLKEYQPRIIGNLISGDLRSSSLIELVIDPQHETELTQLLSDDLIAEDDDAKEDPEDDPTSVEAPFAIDIEFPVDALQLGMSLEQFETLLQHAYPDLEIDALSEPERDLLDRFQVYRMLLAPLAQVQQNKSSHPEGDALYHSLQVFELAQRKLPYDEEFLLAALLHDVGKGIDPLNHTQASLNALNGYITERTAWFIENLHDARRILENSIGSRARRRLHQHPDYEELLLLAKCDRDGCVSGGGAPELESALESIRELARIYG